MPSRRAAYLWQIFATAAIGPGGWVACGWSVDYLDTGNTGSDAGNPPDALTDTGSGARETGADNAVDGGAPDAPLDAKSDSAVADARSEAAAADGGPCDPMTPTSGTNYVGNPDFEDTNNPGGGWFANFGGVFAVSSTQAHCGTHSGESSARTAFYNGIGTDLPTTAGTYTVTMWAMQDGTAPYRVAPSGVLVCGDSGATQYSSIAFNTLQPNVWTYITGTMVVPSGCTSVILALGGDQTETTANPDIFIDDVYAVR